MIEVRTTRTVDATFLGILECLMVYMRAVEHRFGGNTTNVQGRPAKGPRDLLFSIHAAWGRTSPWIKFEPEKGQR